MVEEPINWLFEGGVSNIFNNIGYGFIASFPTPPKFASKLAAQFLLIIALCFLTPPKFASKLANLPSLKGRVARSRSFIGFASFSIGNKGFQPLV